MFIRFLQNILAATGHALIKVSGVDISSSISRELVNQLFTE